MILLILAATIAASSAMPRYIAVPSDQIAFVDLTSLHLRRVPRQTLEPPPPQQLPQALYQDYQDYQPQRQLAQDYQPQRQLAQDYQPQRQLAQDYQLQGQLNPDYQLQGQLNQEYQPQRLLNQDFQPQRQLAQEYQTIPVQQLLPQPITLASQAIVQPVQQAVPAKLVENEAASEYESRPPDFGEYVDFGAHTGDNGAFGWYADYPINHNHDHESENSFRK